MHSIENYNENYYVYMQCSQQLRRTADKKFKIEAESYLSLTLCEEKQSTYSQNPLLFCKDHGNNFPTLQVAYLLVCLSECRRFDGSGELLIILCYWTNMQQPAIKLITSNTAQVNFPA